MHFVTIEFILLCNFAALVVAINRNDVMYGQPRDIVIFSCRILSSRSENIYDYVTDVQRSHNCYACLHSY